MSNPEFDALFEVMARYKNVYTDISGQLKTGSEEDIRDYRQFVSSQIQRFLMLILKESALHLIFQYNL